MKWIYTNEKLPDEGKLTTVAYYTVFDDLPHFGVYDGVIWTDWYADAGLDVLHTSAIICWIEWEEPIEFRRKKIK